MEFLPLRYIKQTGMYKNLREYISLLEREGELVRVGTFVNPVEEMAEIADRMAKSPGGGKALLFENTGTAFPVVMNLFGSDRRIALALGVRSVDEIPQRIEALAKKAMSPKGSLRQKMGVVPLLGEAAKWFPKRNGRRGECQQVVLKGEAASLDALPVLKCWPCDGGRFITLPLVHTADPDTGTPNVGMYRMQIFAGRTTGMHWHMHKTGAKHYEAYKRRGERMPVAVCLGGDPVYTYSSTAPMPDGLDEYILAGFLRRRAVKLVRCITNGLYVPADCDFVIEGYVDPAEEKVTEGPFGDHTGFYSLEDLYPKFHVTAITHRCDAVYPATVVGVPPQEDLYIAKATEKIFLAPIRLAVQPEVTDLYMPGAGIAHNLAVVNIEKSYPGQAAKVASSLWGAGQMMFNKYMMVTATGENIRDPRTLAGLLRGMSIPDAVIRGEGVLDVLDHATATPGTGGKLALNLTEADPNTPPIKVPAGITPGEGIISFDTVFVPEWGVMVLRAAPGAAADVPAFISRNGLEAVKIAALVDEGTETLTPYELLWLAAGDSDPRRDAAVSGGTLIIDARTKLPGAPGNPVRFPNVVASSPEIIALTDKRWAEYGIGGFIESPSSRYRALLRSDKAEI